jgi:hypothetical protein
MGLAITFNDFWGTNRPVSAFPLPNINHFYKNNVNGIVQKLRGEETSRNMIANKRMVVP